MRLLRNFCVLGPILALLACDGEIDSDASRSQPLQRAGEADEPSGTCDSAPVLRMGDVLRTNTCLGPERSIGMCGTAPVTFFTVDLPTGSFHLEKTPTVEIAQWGACGATSPRTCSYNSPAPLYTPALPYLTLFSAYFIDVCGEATIKVVP